MNAAAGMIRNDASRLLGLEVTVLQAAADMVPEERILEYGSFADDIHLCQRSRYDHLHVVYVLQ